MARTSRAVIPPEAPRLDDVPEAVAGLEDEALRAARVVEADVSGQRRRGMLLIDVAIERGNLANLVAPELSLRRVTVTGARLTGVQWTRGRIADVAFRDCRIDLAAFAATTFERATFEGCLLAQADFGEALLRDVRFDGCDLTEADFSGLRLERCELRRCTLDGVVALERLRGAAMPWPDIVGNAGLFAGALGIRALDEDG